MNTKSHTTSRRPVSLLAAGLLLLGGCGSADILNVSYDPTREFYKEYNEAFARHWQETTGKKVSIEMSHAGSRAQARAVIDGQRATVVTLALAQDIELIQEAGLISEGWQERLPNNSCPYTSTIVFLVRKGNPKNIKDWDDLVKDGVSVITPNPKTSGGACWNYLAAWGYALKQELGDLKNLHDPQQAEAVAKAQQAAQEFVTRLFQNVGNPDAGARGATQTFVRGTGDVLLAWENEAFLAINDMGPGKFEIVVPSQSIQAEPPVCLVDKVADQRGKREVSEAYLDYLYSEEGQVLAAKHYYRPARPELVRPELLEHFPKLELFTIGDVFGGWPQAQKTHFGKDGICDKVLQAMKK
jgi:sulfate/thiosulfate transport system substrate-binding protein